MSEDKNLNPLIFFNYLTRGKDGIYHSAKSDPLSYPNDGNALLFEVEDQSFWFSHRNSCIIEMIRNYPPQNKGPIFDIGGGNGFVAKGLLDEGWDVVLLEPGPTGAKHAQKRGIPYVVCATTHTAKLKKGALPAIGVFDVVEHIDDDISFLKHLWDLLAPGGMLYLTVPSYKFLWSHEDDKAGHFHRYSLNQILERVTHVGFNISYSTYIFQWLFFAVGLFRALPYRCGFPPKSKNESVQFQKDHILKKGFSFNLLSSLLKHERGKVVNKLKLPFGGSCMLAARKELDGSG